MNKNTDESTQVSVLQWYKSTGVFQRLIGRGGTRWPGADVSVQHVNDPRHARPQLTELRKWMKKVPRRRMLPNFIQVLTFDNFFPHFFYSNWTISTCQYSRIFLCFWAWCCRSWGWPGSGRTECPRSACEVPLKGPDTKMMIVINTCTVDGGPVQQNRKQLLL